MTALISITSLNPETRKIALTGLPHHVGTNPSPKRHWWMVQLHRVEYCSTLLTYCTPVWRVCAKLKKWRILAKLYHWVFISSFVAKLENKWKRCLDIVHNFNQRFGSILILEFIKLFIRIYKKAFKLTKNFRFEVCIWNIFRFKNESYMLHIIVFKRQWISKIQKCFKPISYFLIYY